MLDRTPASAFSARSCTLTGSLQATIFIMWTGVWLSNIREVRACWLQQMVSPRSEMLRVVTFDATSHTVAKCLSWAMLAAAILVAYLSQPPMSQCFSSALRSPDRAFGLQQCRDRPAVLWRTAQSRRQIATFGSSLNPRREKRRSEFRQECCPFRKLWLCGAGNSQEEVIAQTSRIGIRHKLQLVYPALIQPPTTA